jgi:hypothetical protein
MFPDLPAVSYEKSMYGIPPIMLFLSYSMTTIKKYGYDGKSSPKDRFNSAEAVKMGEKL